MKLPNGYGSVYKLHGNRRKPWCIRVTVSTKPYKYKYLGYYETYEEGLTALAMYNRDPYDLDAQSVTFAEVYERWSEEHYKKISASHKNAFCVSYRTCSPLHDMCFKDIKLSHLQHLIDTCGKNYPAMMKIRLLLNQMYTYAMRHELCQKNYATYIDTNQYRDRNPGKKPHRPFTADEITALWASDAPGAKITLMLIYTGVRIGELLDLKKENVNLKEQWFDVTASKTAAGIRRVPIADKILPFFEEFMQNNAEYVLPSPRGRRIPYQLFLTMYWISEGHTPHDTRHTCISMLANTGTDERIIKRIVGHAGKDVTETVYTHLDFKVLLDAINAI